MSQQEYTPNQPEHLIFNPVFNSFPNNWKSYNYRYIETPYIKLDGTIGWIKKYSFQPGQLFIKLRDVTDYEEYLLDKISKYT